MTEQLLAVIVSENLVQMFEIFQIELHDDAFGSRTRRHDLIQLAADSPGGLSPGNGRLYLRLFNRLLFFILKPIHGKSSFVCFVY